MLDVSELKHRILHGGIAVDEQLQKRILNDQLTDNDYNFLSAAFGTVRQIKKHGTSGMVLEHRCESFSAHDSLEWNEYENAWFLHLDAHCCNTEVKYCPYCGVLLSDALLDSEQK